jgi:outer membrane protein
MTTRTHAIALALGLLSAAPALAQDTVSLSVDEAVARAVAHAPRLAEARARSRAAAATVDARAALARPALAASSGFVRTNHVDEFGITQPNGDVRVIFPDIPSNYRVRAELGVPLYTAGRVDALVDAARADARATAAEGVSAAADVELEAIVSYWSLATARERVAVLVRAQERADAVVSDATARVEAGLVPPSEQLSAQAQRARQRVALIQARNDAAVAEAQLVRLTGLPPETAISLETPADTPRPVGGEGQTQADLVARATATRAERLALRERQAAAQAAGAAAVAALRPQIAALAAVEPARPNARFVPRADRWHTSWDLGVTVSWSLWDGGRARAERAAALAQAEAIGARLEDFDAAVGVEIRQRRLDVESARAAIEAAGEAVAAAAEARRVLGERFEAGVATSTEVLDSDIVLLESELERARLMAALRVNEARLARALGGRP